MLCKQRKSKFNSQWQLTDKRETVMSEWIDISRPMEILSLKD